MKAAHAALIWLLVLSPNLRARARYNPPPACNNPFTAEQELAESRKICGAGVSTESDLVSRYNAQLGAHMAEHAPGAKWPFSFHVVVSSDINAFALPGGAVFVNLGTIYAAHN